ncbi:MAG: hypothetical protein ACLTGI_00370 [Hoylesella buccalis]
MKVYGVSNSNLKLTAEDTMTMNVSTSRSIVVDCDMNGDQREEPFECEVEATGTDLTVGDIVENRDAHQFTIPVTCWQEHGRSHTEGDGTQWQVVQGKIYQDNHR